MNFSKFRQSGELSDISVIVDDTEFKLHKFPLYAKSDFFCALAKSPGADCNRVELKEFPGGPEAFAVVADFCYSMKVEITKTNVVHIRCAAEVLQMTGSGNLAEVCDKFLLDTITSAKMSRAASSIAALLLSCVPTSAVAEKANIVSLCSEALVDSWLKPPTKFSTPAASKKAGNGKEEESIKYLMNIPVNWFIQLLTSAREKKVKNKHLAEMVVKFVSAFLESEESEAKVHQVTDQKKSDTVENKSKSTRSSRDNDSAKDSKTGSSKSKKKTDTGKVLDNILSELPEEAFQEDIVTTDWVTKVLKVATALNCKCRRLLVRVAGDRLNSLSAEDLCIISPSVLKDIVSESYNGDSAQGTKACQLVETYMNEMSRKGVLTAETYKTLVSAGPPESRKSHDTIYGILEYVLTAEKDKLKDDQREELLDTVDFTLLGEATLKRAYETQVVPASFVAKGALSLCSKLKSELETAKNTVSRQEDELQRLRRARTVTPTVTPSPKKENESAHSSFSELPVRDSNPGSSVDVISENVRHSPMTSTVTRHSPLTSTMTRLSPVTSSMTEDILMAARNKLASSVAAYNTFRPLSAEEYSTYDDDMDYKYDRQFRSFDNARNKQRSASFRSSYLYPHRH